MLGVMVYFHTPYYGKDELYLDAAERATSSTVCWG